MSSRLSLRLSRLLNMVPYLLAHPGISAAEAAAELGVTTKQLMSDLNQLWMCGLPGYGPGDLIDLSFSEESIEVTFSAGIERPLRLTSTEATALLVALRSIVEMPGMVDPTAAHAAIAKIESAIAGSGDVSRAPVRVPVERPVVATVRAALADAHALRLVYYSASRDEVSERVVDPIRVVLVDNNSYLQAWCRQAEGVRLFRFDRIEDATELDERAHPPSHAAADAAALDLFQDDPDVPLARLRIRADYAWVLDQYPMHRIRSREDGSIEAGMRFASPDWMARLLLGFGTGVSVLGPPELVTAVRERADAALAAYAAAGLVGETEPA
ncbi:helix-turn-helix transcriptional regulator [Nocardia caishijiensis]|uniref:Proteasome accessory factor C n=1 Tax=Nocardia caishijiensis TaxID=184756 RepID=A0ABQ6YMZ9_9NOCA|nr:YafY family protein [Nocardia caishijiensis]KAF0847155.1 proteasome accessory factor C [Nocardia caishijiensis]